MWIEISTSQRGQNGDRKNFYGGHILGIEARATRVPMQLSDTSLHDDSIRSSADADKSARRVWRSLKVTRHGTIRYVKCGLLLVFYSNFVRKTHRFLVIRLQKCCDLENRVRGLSRSLEMSPFDRAHDFLLTFCSNYVYSHVVFEIFKVEKYRDLENRVGATQGHRNRHVSIRHL